MARELANALNVRPMGIAGRAPVRVSVATSGSGTIPNSANNWVLIKVSGANQVKFAWNGGNAVTNGYPLDYGEVEVIYSEGQDISYNNPSSTVATEFVYAILS